MAIFSTAVSVTSAGTQIFAADPATLIFSEIVYVTVNTGTCFIGGGTSSATGGGTTSGLPITPANLSLPIPFGSTDKLFGITSTGTADLRVMLFSPSR